MLNFILGLFESYYYSSLHHALIIIHVAAAIIALLVAPAAMMVVKGGPAHRRWGRIYFWAMFVTNTLAMWLLFWRFNTVLFGVTITSLYGALTGYRAIYRKQSQVRWFDWGISAVVLAVGITLIAWAALAALGITSQFMPSGDNLPVVTIILPLAFGAMMISDSLADLRMYRAPSQDHRWWWYYHMERMLGSYIGLCTALMVQQVGPRLPESIAWVAWVAPSALGIPLIALWIRRYQHKFTKTERSIPTQPALTSVAE